MIDKKEYNERYIEWEIAHYYLEMISGGAKRGWYDNEKNEDGWLW